VIFFSPPYLQISSGPLTPGRHTCFLLNEKRAQTRSRKKIVLAVGHRHDHLRRADAVTADDDRVEANEFRSTNNTGPHLFRSSLHSRASGQFVQFVTLISISWFVSFESGQDESETSDFDPIYQLHHAVSSVPSV